MIPTVQLDEIAEVKLGRQRSPKDHSGDQMRPYVRAANVGWSGWKLDDVKSMNFTDAEMDVYRLKPGDLLLGEASGSAAEVGKPALWQGEIENCAFQNTLIRVRPRGADSRYLLHYFSHCAATGKFARSSRGVGIFHLGRKALAEWQVPLPPIEEQRRIAAVVDAADALRAKRRQALAKLDTLTQAIFIDMFGDLVANPMGWPVHRLSEVCRSIQIGPFGSLLHQSDYIVDGVPIVNPMHIVEGKIVPRSDQTVGPDKAASLASYRLAGGDIVMGRRGEMGRCAVVGETEEGYLCGSGSLFFRPDSDRLLPEFLARAMSSERAKRRLESSAQGVTMLNLNSEIVGGFKIGIPPIELQRLFQGVLARRDEAAVKAKIQAEGLDTLFASLQQRAFRGDL